MTSPESFHSYEPKLGHGLAHNPLNAIVAPRPIGWLATTGADGHHNLAPYSFFNLFNYDPPILGFASTAWKDTAENVKRTGEFVWNLVTVPLLPQMNETSATVPPHVDEFDLASLTKRDSVKVAPPRVGESPVSFECKLTQQFELTDAAGRPTGAWMTFGEAVMIHLREDLIDDGIFDTVRVDPLLRGGGPSDYFSISHGARMNLARPN